jgi:ATP-binding cassette, subfamily B, bacterial
MPEQRNLIIKRLVKKRDTDEPTSAMDSWAENDWLKRFNALAKGKTTLIITHRFTTAMQADVIHVMDKGVIIESGKHDELISKGRMYARSWKEQTKEYKHTA